MNKTISVIIPIYKVEDYLDQCIDSIINQTYKELEIILVDDGSPDNCPFMCDRWKEKDDRIKVIHKKNGGLSDARNAGLQICTGEYIAFVDSDDWIELNMYETMLQYLNKEDADICACNITSCFPNKRVVWGCKNYTVGDSATILNLLYSDAKYPVCAWNKLYKRYLWEEFQFPVGKLCEDAFTTYLLVHKAKKIVQITEPLYNYRIRPESIMTANFTSKRMDEEEAWRMNYQFVEKHYPKLSRKSYDFYLESVNVLIHTIPDDKKELYDREYSYLKSILKSNLIYIMLRSKLNLKHRAHYILSVLRL